MTLFDFIRIIRKHLVLLILAPVLLAGLVAVMTRHPDFKFSSETKLYTGITTGSSVEMDKTLNYFAASTAFDNLINIIKSRKTHQEVAIKLLAQHLMLSKPDPKYISSLSYSRLNHLTPSYVRKLVELTSGITVADTTSAVSTLPDTTSTFSLFNFENQKIVSSLTIPPPGMDIEAYNRTVKALTDLMTSSDTNFVYRLLNFDDPHYSINAISSVNVQRIGTSDMVQLKYETDDPGICQQTLAIMIDVCVHNYKNIKENQSDAVVRYFEYQLGRASGKLKVAEDKLLKFNKENNIINYYEQSKAVAIAKEALDVDYNNMRIKLAGIEAAIQNIEQKLSDQKNLQIKSAGLLARKDELGTLAYKIATAEAKSGSDEKDIRNLAAMKIEAEKIKEDIMNRVSEFYRFSNSSEGLPVGTLLKDWIDNVIEGEYARAGLRVLGERIIEFQKQYSIYAPAGANVKRIEREINVSEGEYLEILHGLNLARLKLQDNELSSNIKTVDPPFFPLSPNKTKRKLLVVVGALAGFILVLSVVLFLEFFDNTLKNPDKASSILKMKMAGMMPKIFLKSRKINLPYVVNRLLEISLQNVGLAAGTGRRVGSPITIVVFSTSRREGKTTVAGNLAHKLKKNGEKVLFMNYSGKSLEESEREHIGFSEYPPAGANNNPRKIKTSVPFVRIILGYPDNRVDHDSIFLADPHNYLDAEEYVEYSLDEKFSIARDYKELMVKAGKDNSRAPDYVIVELPPVLLCPAPVTLLADSGLILLVCRSNREWNSADNSAMANIRSVTEGKLMFFLNGVDMPAVESVLGDLPKVRSRFRRIMKKAFLLQFSSDNQI
jgi:polysaccharide biosynthesis transport protein